MTPEEIDILHKTTKELLNLQLIEIPSTVCKWKNYDDIQHTCLKLGKSVQKNQNRAYLLTGTFGITIGQWLIRKKIIKVPTNVEFGKPPPENEAAIIFYPGNVWFGSWNGWIEEMKSLKQ